MRLEVCIWLSGHVYALDGFPIAPVSQTIAPAATAKADRSRVIYPQQRQQQQQQQPTTRLSVGVNTHCCYVAQTRGLVTLFQVTSINTPVPTDAIALALGRRDEFTLTLNGLAPAATRPYRNETLRFTWRLSGSVPLSLRWVRQVTFPRADSGYANKVLEYNVSSEDIAAHRDCDETRLVCAPAKNIVLTLGFGQSTEIELLVLKWRLTIEQWAVAPG
jgi:hypothetical protein